MGRQSRGAELQAAAPFHPERAFNDQGPAVPTPTPVCIWGPSSCFLVVGGGDQAPVPRRRPAVSMLPLPTLQNHYEHYHGFVVIHGTDTMAFAASVLSFVLENLQKPVILTGAQVTSRLAGGAQGSVGQLGLPVAIVGGCWGPRQVLA